MKTDKLYIRAAAVSVIAAAYICRLIGLLFPGLEFFTYLRLTLHIGLFSAWGFSLNRRLVQKKVKKYLLSVVVLLPIVFSWQHQTLLGLILLRQEDL